jgi:hypothetical protein
MRPGQVHGPGSCAHLESTQHSGGCPERTDKTHGTWPIPGTFRLHYKHGWLGRQHAMLLGTRSVLRLALLAAALLCACGSRCVIRINSRGHSPWPPRRRRQRRRAPFTAGAARRGAGIAHRQCARPPARRVPQQLSVGGGGGDDGGDVLNERPIIGILTQVRWIARCWSAVGFGLPVRPALLADVLIRAARPPPPARPTRPEGQQLHRRQLPQVDRGRRGARHSHLLRRDARGAAGKVRRGLPLWLGGRQGRHRARLGAPAAPHLLRAPGQAAPTKARASFRGRKPPPNRRAQPPGLA